MFRAPVGYVVPLIGRSLGGTLTGGDVVTAAAPHRWVLYDVDFNTGRVRWERTLHTAVPPVKHAKNSYGSETPVMDGERVYVYSSSVGLFAFDMNGTPLWSTLCQALGAAGCV